MNQLEKLRKEVIVREWINPDDVRLFDATGQEYYGQQNTGAELQEDWSAAMHQEAYVAYKVGELLMPASLVAHRILFEHDDFGNKVKIHFSSLQDLLLALPASPENRLRAGHVTAWASVAMLGKMGLAVFMQENYDGDMACCAEARIRPLPAEVFNRLLKE